MSTKTRAKTESLEDLFEYLSHAVSTFRDAATDRKRITLAIAETDSILRRERSRIHLAPGKEGELLAARCTWLYERRRALESLWSSVSATLRLCDDIMRSMELATKEIEQ